MYKEGDKHWLGGIIDGEGSLYMTYSKGRYRPEISVRNTDFSMLDEVLRIAQMGYITKAEIFNERSKPGKKWKLDARMYVRDFLVLMLPYIRTKKRQAELMLEWISLAPYKQRGVPVPAICDEIAKEICTMNKRGVVV